MKNRGQEEPPGAGRDGKKNRSEKEVGYSEKFRQKHVLKTNLRAEFMKEIATFKKKD